MIKLRNLSATKLAQIEDHKRHQLRLGKLLTRLFTRSHQPSNYEDNYQKCESPIEQAFFDAGWARLSMLGTFTPQVDIGPYRADFALTGMKQAPLLKVVIECDGWKYHDTADQQSHDRKRENYMKVRGWAVIRFTGQQIFHDAAGCVDDLEEIVKSRLRAYRGVR